MATASRKDLPAALAAPAPAMTPAGHEAALRRLHRLGRHARSTAAAPAATAAPVPPPSLPRARDAEDDSVRKDDMAAGTATSRAAGASAGSAGVSAGSTVAIGGSAGGASGAALARAATAGAGGSGFDFGLFRVARDLTTIAFGDLDLESARHGGQLVARVLEAHGVKFVFTLTGGHISPILVAAEKSSGIRVIDTRHEAVAVFAADAVGRLTGTAGVAAVTAGPGTANAVCAIRNCQMAESPMVLLGGAAATMLQGRGSLQDVDQLSLLRPIVKYAASVSTVRDIVPTLRRAFQEAMSGVPGPVFVELPLDILYPATEATAGMGLSLRRRRREITPEPLQKALIVPTDFEAPGGAKPGSVERAQAYVGTLAPDQPVFLDPAKLSEGDAKEHGIKMPVKQPWVVDRYMKFKLANLFTDAWSASDFGPLPVTFPMPSEGDVGKAAELLRRAVRPVIVLGSQSTLQAKKVDELAAALESFGAPTFLGGMARGMLGARSRAHVRQNRGVALRKADVVILAGVVADFRLDYGRALSRRSKIVAVNRGRDSLTLNSDAFWSPTVAAVADPCEFMLKLLARVGGGSAGAGAGAAGDGAGGGARHAEWLASLKASEGAKEKANKAKAAEPAIGRLDKGGERLINPLHLCFAMEEALDEDSVLVADGGDFVATASYIVRPRGPLRWLDPGAFGTLGVGAGFALAAKLVRPSAEVWLIWGDGSCGYSVAEFDTFKRHNIPIIAVVGNDACWTQIEREQVPMMASDVACPLAYCSYDKVAEGYGGEGLVLDSPEQDVAATLAEARRIAKSGSPVLVNALIGRTNFREGSLSV